MRPLTFFGHTHVQRCLLLEALGQGKSFAPNYQIRQKGKQTTKLENQAKDNVHGESAGSVGQPRDNDPRAAFLLYDTDAGVITFYRVPYNIEPAHRKKSLPPDCRSAWPFGWRKAVDPEISLRYARASAFAPRRRTRN